MVFRIISFFILSGIINVSFANTYYVGSDYEYKTPNSLYQASVISAGDSIYIESGMYSGNDALAVWSEDNLFISGINGKVDLFADGEYIWGKGIWVFGGDNIYVQNINFHNASVPDKNGAGIRLDGSGVTVMHCGFYNNENGILTNNTYSGKVIIHNCEFQGGGFGDGLSHNLYIGHNDYLNFQFNYVHGAKIGHNLKSRADTNIIAYNRILDESNGTSSRLIDIPNGGFTLILGNVLQQSVSAENINLVGYGLEGLSNPSKEFLLINNTLINEKTTNGLFIDIEDGTEYVDVSNNLFAGLGAVISGNYDYLESNYYDEIITNFLFVDASNYDYRITEKTTVIDVGMDKNDYKNFSLIPLFQYDSDFQVEDRITFNKIDMGAYEYEPLSKNKLFSESKIKLYPNPTSDLIFIETNKVINRIFIYDFNGVLIKTINTNKIETKDIKSKIIYLDILFNDGNKYSEKVILNN